MNTVNGCIKWAALILFTILTACGEDSGSGAGSAKSITSVWTSTENSTILNFENAVIGQEMEIAMALVNEKTCQCTILITGTDSNGTVTTSDCVELSAGTSSSPSCSDVEAAPTYSIENNVLTLCRDGSCSTWE